MPHVISINHLRFVERADCKGLATTSTVEKAQVFHDRENLFATLAWTLSHGSDVVITLVPK